MRQMNVMNEEEKANKMVQIAKRQEELNFKAMVHEACRQMGLDVPGTKSWM